MAESTTAASQGRSVRRAIHLVGKAVEGTYGHVGVHLAERLHHQPFVGTIGHER